MIAAAIFGLARPSANAAASESQESQEPPPGAGATAIETNAGGPGTVVEAPVGSSVETATLDSLSLESPAYRDALASRDQALQAIQTAEQRIPVLDRALVDLHSAGRQIEAGLPRLEATADAADAAVMTARDDLAVLAVLRYVYADSSSVVEVLGAGLEDQTVRIERDLVMRAASAAHSYLVESTEETRLDATSATDIAKLSIVEVSARTEALIEELARTRELIETQSALLPELEERVTDERKVSRITGSDLTVVVVDAYLRAAETLRTESPECGVSWTLLAGIGRVESRHGTYSGSSVGLDGLVTPSIIGIALNGQLNTAVISDSDGGLLDGDTINDRAVGPMQFIPSTWRGYGRDGNNDGLVDPQNIYDSALSAATYLCSRGSVSTPAAEVGAILRYNSSMAYVRAVQGNARRYDELEIDAQPVSGPSADANVSEGQ